MFSLTSFLADIGLFTAESGTGGPPVPGLSAVKSPGNEVAFFH